MKAWQYILVFVLTLCGCASSQLPIDDVYHWEAKRSSTEQVAQSTQNTQSTQSNQTTQSKPKTPNLEVINQQDTTITVKIHR